MRLWPITVCVNVYCIISSHFHVSPSNYCHVDSCPRRPSHQILATPLLKVTFQGQLTSVIYWYTGESTNLPLSSHRLPAWLDFYQLDSHWESCSFSTGYSAPDVLSVPPQYWSCICCCVWESWRAKSSAKSRSSSCDYMVSSIVRFYFELWIVS